MKNYITTGILFMSLIFSVFPQSTKDAKPFTLNGKIIGKNSGRIVLRYWGETKFISDTASILNGAFVFKGKIIETARAEIISKKDDLNRKYIYLEPGIMTINLTADKFGELKMTGSKTAQEQKQLMPQEENISRRRKVLNAEFKPELLTTLNEKLTQLESMNIDSCIVLDFTLNMAGLSAYEFLKTILKEKFCVHTLLVGHDHRFGHNRTDGFPEYKKYGELFGMNVVQCDQYNTESDKHISSSEIRNALKNGDIELSNRLLTYQYSLQLV